MGRLRRRFPLSFPIFTERSVKMGRYRITNSAEILWRDLKR